ncbi:hypothetical protein NIES2119_31970 [[Phormidium ambiguum] IAM M-71]|uniref:Uncharacterized protein n=1 Tax=[Phormidium ambiguum] IAM M-71 TaxID=454136 RepID=A0A1U7I1E0_9CYAN|nr:plasmid replication protein, CyRepA1 family [Phormidium ambiguum]OKH29783.1 hypothetical protein NIES2119_31970 [Phormidium ambiguum IAM M-71]
MTSKNRLIPTSKTHTCPICNDTSGDCRIHSHQELILCHSFIDQDAQVNSWRYLRKSKCGTWGVYITDNGKYYSTEQRTQRQRIRQLQKQRQLAGALPIPERDKGFRQLSHHLGLTTRHRQKLHSRHLNDQQIQSVEYFSIFAHQELPWGIPINFPGVDRTGTKLWIKPENQGIAIPIRNQQNQIIGCQIRRDSDEGPRYLWLGGGDKSSRLPNGEMPLGFCRPSIIQPIQRQNVGLAEGFLKSQIAAFFLGQIILGAAGGQFEQSPQQLKQYLTSAGVQLGDYIDIYPDAGDILNRHVMNRWQKLVNLLQNWGYLVQFAWWGQISKEACDIDELQGEDLAKIQYISTTQFFALSEQLRGETLPKTDEQIRRQRYLEEISLTYKQLTTLTYQPNLELNQEYLPDNLWEKLPSQGIVAINSRKGSGKSKAILRPLISHFKELGKRILSIVPRVVLGREQCVKFDLLWVDELGETQSSQLRQLGGAVCWDSLLKLFEQHWDIIIIDEARMGFKHLLTANTAVKQQRPQILQAFSLLIERVLSNKGAVVLCDADLSNPELDYIKSLSPNHTPTYIVVNHHRGTPREFVLYKGEHSKQEVERQIYAHIERIINLDDSDPEKEPIIITADSQSELEAIERELIDAFPQLKTLIIRIDGKTSEEEWAKDFVAEINQEIHRLKPLVLLYSPSMAVGVSIEINWFKQIFALYSGVLEPCEFRQQLARNRQNIPIILWSANQNNQFTGCSSPLPRVIKTALAKNIKDSQQEDILQLAYELAREESEGDLSKFQQVFQQIWNNGNWNNPHLELWVKIQARINYSKPHCGENIQIELRERENALITSCVGEENGFGTRITRQKKQMKQELATLLSTGANSPMTWEEAQEIKRNPQAKFAHRMLADGVLLREYLPGVNLTPEFIYKYKISHPHWLTSQFLYWLATHPHECKSLDSRQWKSHGFKWMSGEVFLPDLRPKIIQAQLLVELGIIGLIQKEENFSKSSPLIQEIMRRAMEKSDRLKRYFNLKVTSSTDPISFVGKLLKKAGVSSKKVYSDGKFRYYTVFGQNQPERLAVLLAWNQKNWDLQPESAKQAFLMLNACSLTNKDEALVSPERQQQLQVDENVVISISKVNKKPELEADPTIKWLLDLLADLEIDLEFHPRFYSEDLVDSFALAELLSQECQERLMKICPDYWDRVVHALGRVSEFLGDSSEELGDDVKEQHINPPPEHYYLKWLLNLLTDLEATPSPHPRFDSSEKLADLLNQANLLAIHCKSELLKACPDYWERCSQAAAQIIKLLPSSTVPNFRTEEISGCVHRLKAAIEYGTAWVKIVLKPWQTTQRRVIVQALGTVAQSAVLRLTQILPDWLTWDYQF